MQRRTSGGVPKDGACVGCFPIFDEDNRADVASINVGESGITFPLATIANDCNGVAVFINDRNWRIHRLDIARTINSK